MNRLTRARAAHGTLPPISLIPAVDGAFRWLIAPIDESPVPYLKLAPGGFETPEMLRDLRETARRARDLRTPAAWLIVNGGEVVGLINYKNAPRSSRAVEIGYGVAASRRNRGFASAAVASLIKIAERDSRIHMLTAQTVFGNGPSERVLSGNGFSPMETRIDEDTGGAIRVWRLWLS